jgi:hypothetical protein
MSALGSSSRDSSVGFDGEIDLNLAACTDGACCRRERGTRKL